MLQCILRYINYLAGVSGWGGTFETFHPAVATHCTDGLKSTVPRQISPQHGFMMRTFLL